MKPRQLKSSILMMAVFLAGCMTYSDVNNLKDLKGLQGKAMVVRCRNMDTYHLDHASVNEKSITGSGKKYDAEKNVWRDFSGSISLAEISNMAVEAVDFELTVKYFIALAIHAFAVVFLYVFFGISRPKIRFVSNFHRRIT